MGIHTPTNATFLVVRPIRVFRETSIQLMRASGMIDEPDVDLPHFISPHASLPLIFVPIWRCVAFILDIGII